MSLGSRTPDPPSELDRPCGSPGSGPIVVLYADFECPRCALAWSRLSADGLRVGIRHFPITSSHPNARTAACAAEAADIQGAFHRMVGSMFLDQGRLDQAHLWEKADEMGLDARRFASDMRSDAVARAVEESFRSAIRAGVATSPTILANDGLHPGVPDQAAVEAWRSGQLDHGQAR